VFRFLTLTLELTTGFFSSFPGFHPSTKKKPTLLNFNVQFQKISILPPLHPPVTKRAGISWGWGGSLRPKNVKKCMKLNWSFQRDGEG